MTQARAQATAIGMDASGRDAVTGPDVPSRDDLIKHLQLAEAAFRGIASNSTRCPACDMLRGLAERKEMEIRSFLGEFSDLKRMRQEWCK